MQATTISGVTVRQLVERDERVFPTYPQVGRYFPAGAIEDARQRLSRTIERGDGPGLIVGGPGTGKSLLLQVLASQYHERFDVVLPACARLCTRRALLQAILFELGLPYRVRDEGDLRLSLLDHLLSREECPDGLLLLVDEAQTLSVGLLDELRVLTNLVRGGLPRVRLVLAGSSALEECFAHPELESFSQRLSARCYLGPFGREETAQYVRAQLAGSGAVAEDVFASESFDAVFEATDGVPRLVNQVCDRALMEAAAAGRPRVDRMVVQSAWADIQQLPAPWETPAPTTEPPAPLQVVEFGELDEHPAELSRLSSSSFADDSADDDLVDPEPTELDSDDDSEVGAHVQEAAPRRTEVSPSASANPFAEEFDEEEVVIDSFASWDNMFRQDAPRVHNRRDPEFAALVHAAVSQTDISQTLACAMHDGSALALESASEVDTAAANEPAPLGPSTSRDTSDWPPLRLAVVSDAGGFSEPAPRTAQRAENSSAWNVPPTRPGENGWSEDDDLLWASVPVGAPPSCEEEPVLIVEDDAPVPKSPVRREEYRNLFSRLRSG